MVSYNVREICEGEIDLEETFIVVDGNSLMHRAFHALPPLTTSTGAYTNAVMGFTSMLLKLLGEVRPDYLAVAFDMHGPTFRHADYADYKAGRKPTAEELRPQFPLLRRLLDAMQVAQLELPSFEADDMLGTVSRLCEERSIRALLVTGDRDAMQLVSDRTHVLYTKRGISDTVEFDPETVLSTFGVTPAQIPDLKGLMGDASDNIPGVPGVGEKTAVKLLTEYGSVERALSAAETDLKGKLRERMIEGRTSALMSKKIATITREVPIELDWEACRLHDLSGGEAVLEELEMKSLIPRLKALGAKKPEDDAKSIPQTPWREEEALSTPEDIRRFIGDLPQAHDATVALCLSDALTLACQNGARARVCVAQDLLTDGLDPQEALRALSPLLTGERALCVFGAKRLLTQLAQWGIPCTAIEADALLEAYLLDPQQKRYEAPADAAALYDLHAAQCARLEEAGMLPLYYTIEMPLMRTLFSMEQEGFLVNREELLRLGAGYTEELERLRQEIYALTGVEGFNISSPKQLGEVLFERLGLPTGRKTKSGYSTDADTLEAIADKHPAIDKILSYRQLSKLNGTYVEGMVKLIGRDGRIHTWFDQTATATGRISSNEPNLQNIPVRTALGREIRRAFIAREGWVLCDADYSQIELRLLAHLSQDAGMIEAFTSGQDIHARTAAEVYGVPLEEVTPAMRSAAKAVNFGIVYGISDFGLARNIGVSRREAQEFIDRYFARYPGVHRFMESAVAKGKALGYSTTMFGRRRLLPELSSSNYNTRSFGERAAMNTPVQGTAADIIKLAMVRVHGELEKRGLRARLILQVHDELIVEAPPEEEGEVIEVLKGCMEGAASLSVPLVADVHTGKTWYEAK